MISDEQISMYKVAIVKAKENALAEIDKATQAATSRKCQGCQYCERILQNKQTLHNTTSQLLDNLACLDKRAIPYMEFSKRMTHDTVLYSGFITPEGIYVDTWEKGHTKVREAYVLKHGTDYAYSMIKVHARVTTTEVQLFDYRRSPSAEQYEVIKQLMLDARGFLSFAFFYDTRHPSL